MKNKILASLLLLSMTSSMFSNLSYIPAYAEEYTEAVTTEAALTEDSLSENIPYLDNVNTDSNDDTVLDTDEDDFNDISVDVEHNRYSITYGDSVTLSVQATCKEGELHYQWMKKLYTEEYYSEITNATSNTLTIDSVTESAIYSCVVSNDYNHSMWSEDIYVNIENTLKCSGERTLLSIVAGESAQLKVNASCTTGELSYQWSLNDTSLEGDSNILEVSPSSDTIYKCTVTDQYYNSESISFHVYVTSDATSDIVYLVCWDDDSESYYQKILQEDSSLQDKVKIINVGVGGTDEYYLQAILSYAKDNKVIAAADISLMDSLATSDTFISMDEVGITEEDYKNAYPCAIKKGTYNGKLMTLTPYVTTGNLIYRADIAEKVFGTSEPDEVEQLLNTPEKFLAAAQKLKDAGYYAFSNNIYYDANNPGGSLINSLVQSTEEAKAANQFGKQLYENGYTKETSMWSGSWQNDMMENSDVFAFNSCTWFNATYASIRGNNNNINYCQAPFFYTWGGTYYYASTNCKGDETAQQLLKDLCCNTDTMTALAEYKGFIPNNRVVAKALAAKENPFCLTSHNQNIYAFFDRITAAENNYQPSEPLCEHETLTPSFTWSEDHSTCDYELVCDSCSKVVDSGSITAIKKTSVATCTEDGSVEYLAGVTYNEVEYKADSYKEVIPALGHDYVEGTAVDATYRTEGHTASVICSRCDDVQTAETVIPALSFSVNYDGNGSTSGTMEVQTDLKYTVGGSLTKYAYEKTGFTFNGWNSKADGTGTDFADEANICDLIDLVEENNGVVTLYAQWKPISYTIHFDKNGGTGTMKRVYPKYGRNYRLPANAFKKAGYTFAGWNTRKDGKGTTYKNQSNVKNLSSTQGKVITLYAQWKKISLATPGKPALGNYAAGRLTVTCKEVKGADGYLIQYSTNKNMKNAKTVSTTTLKKNIYNLKKGTTYHVRVRAYKVDSTGKKVCGKYSSIQSKKVTK